MAAAAWGSNMGLGREFVDTGLRAKYPAGLDVFCYQLVDATSRSRKQSNVLRLLDLRVHEVVIP